MIGPARASSPPALDRAFSKPPIMDATPQQSCKRSIAAAFRQCGQTRHIAEDLASDNPLTADRLLPRVEAALQSLQVVLDGLQCSLEAVKPRPVSVSMRRKPVPRLAQDLEDTLSSSGENDSVLSENDEADEDEDDEDDASEELESADEDAHSVSWQSEDDHSSNRSESSEEGFPDWSGFERILSRNSICEKPAPHDEELATDIWTAVANCGLDCDDHFVRLQRHLSKVQGRDTDQGWVPDTMRALRLQDARLDLERSRKQTECQRETFQLALTVVHLHACADLAAQANVQSDYLTTLMAKLQSSFEDYDSMSEEDASTSELDSPQLRRLRLVARQVLNRASSVSTSIRHTTVRSVTSSPRPPARKVSIRARRHASATESSRHNIDPWMRRFVDHDEDAPSTPALTVRTTITDAATLELPIQGFSDEDMAVQVLEAADQRARAAPSTSDSKSSEDGTVRPLPEAYVLPSLSPLHEDHFELPYATELPLDNNNSSVHDEYSELHNAAVREMASGESATPLAISAEQAPRPNRNSADAPCVNVAQTSIDPQYGAPVDALVQLPASSSSFLSSLPPRPSSPSALMLSSLPPLPPSPSPAEPGDSAWTDEVALVKAAAAVPAPASDLAPSETHSVHAAQEQEESLPTRASSSIRPSRSTELAESRVREDLDADLMLALSRAGKEHFNHARTAQASENLDLALQYARRLSASRYSQYNLTEERLMLASIYLQKRELDRAVEHLRTLVVEGECREENTKLVYDAYYKLAQIYLLQRNFEDAESCCQKAIHGRGRMQGRDSQAYHKSIQLLVLIYRSKGSNAEAVDMLHKLPGDMAQETESRLHSPITEHSTSISPPLSPTSSSPQRSSAFRSVTSYSATQHRTPSTIDQSGRKPSYTFSELGYELPSVAQSRASSRSSLGSKRPSFPQNRELDAKGLLTAAGFVDDFESGKALIWAIVENHFKVVNHLLEGYPIQRLRRSKISFLREEVIEVKKASANGNPRLRRVPLLVAIQYGRTMITQLLLDHGASMQVKDEKGRNPLRAAAEGGHVDIVKLLLAPDYMHCHDGAVLPTEHAQRSYAAIHGAAACGHEAIVNVLISHGGPADMQDGYGSTALKVAAQKGHEGVTRLLLQRGASVDLVDDAGWTALHAAAYNGHEGVVRQLLRNGAMLDRGNSVGQTALTIAAEQGREAVVKALLFAGAATESRDDAGFTPLIAAANKSHRHIIVLLLAHRADINAQTDLGSTALDRAEYWQDQPLMHFLAENGALHGTRREKRSFITPFLGYTL